MEGEIVMDERVLTFKAAVTAIFGIIGELLGWKGLMMLMLAAMMALDYISGSMAAKKNGEWSSQVAREGLAHKGGTIVVVIVALLADALFVWALPEIPLGGFVLHNPGAFLPLVLAWYIITEAGSVLENAVKMGAPVPAWFRKAIRNVGQAVDKAGDKITKDSETK